MSVCLNHTDRPAPNRCKSCLKPFCNECATPGDDGIYCSQACIDNTLRFRERLQSLGPIKPPPSPLDALRAPLLLLVLVFFGVMVFWAIQPQAAPAGIRHWLMVTLYHQQPLPSPHPKHK